MTVAVVGASSDRKKFGNKAFRAFRAAGHKVIPINPHEASVEGSPTFPSVTDVPEEIDMATVYVPPEIGITLLEGFEQKKIGEVWINPGAESDELIAEARRRRINVIEACSIVGIGQNPYSY